MRSRSTLLAVTGAVLIACGSAAYSPGGAGDGGTAEDLPSACAALASAFCAKGPCDGPYGDYPNAETCLASWRAECLAVAKEQGTGYTPAALRTCAAKIDSANCFDQWLVFEGPECSLLNQGEILDGAPCRRGYQCKSGTCTGTETQCGVCKPGARETESCSAAAPCAPNLSCKEGRCERVPLRGEPCNTYAKGGGMFCASPFVCVAGKCADANQGFGEPCNVDDDACDVSQGLHCVATPGDAGTTPSTEGTCARYRIAAAGASCTVDECGPGATCVSVMAPDGGFVNATQTCTPRSNEGEPCKLREQKHAPTGPSCLPTLYCSSERCVRYTEAPCTTAP